MTIWSCLAFNLDLTLWLSVKISHNHFCMLNVSRSTPSFYVSTKLVSLIDSTQMCWVLWLNPISFSGDFSKFSLIKHYLFLIIIYTPMLLP